MSCTAETPPSTENCPSQRNYSSFVMFVRGHFAPGGDTMRKISYVLAAVAAVAFAAPAVAQDKPMMDKGEMHHDMAMHHHMMHHHHMMMHHHHRMMRHMMKKDGM